MSYAFTFDAFQISGITKGQQHVLAAISTFADKNGICWPSVETIAARCLSSVRTVQERLNGLVAKGLLKRIYRKGTSSVYKLLFSGEKPAPTPANSAPPPPQILHPNLSFEPVNQTTAAPATPLPETASAAIVVSESEQPQEPKQQPATEEFTPGATEIASLLGEPVPTAPELAAVEPVSALVIEENPLESVPATLLADLGEVRKAKKKPAKPTRTEANLWWIEAQKAGWTMEQVVLTMVLRGWSRFQADWVAHVPLQAAVQGQQAVFKPEPVRAASPSVIARAKADLARIRATFAPDVLRKAAQIR